MFTQTYLSKMSIKSECFKNKVNVYDNPNNDIPIIYVNFSSVR